ncbi:MAG: 50S ribosomal protein L10 [Flavobacteriaceae bacterium]|nr:50S ribosomal protein L10 [Flavobacteriaceae bacterium]|tara:strand:- start:26179 stop:26703 length:525 start_codon:yes stop_codon:yes gene_type:complete
MTKEEKILEIENLTSRLNDVKNLYITDIAGLNALETSNLRRMCFKAGIKLSVVKNTLLERAMKSSGKDFGELKDLLKGNTSLMFSKSGNGPAKIIKDFRKKSDKPILKGAFIEETVYVGDDQINNLVALKSKEEVIGDIISILQSPAKNLISALKSGGGKVSGILKSLSERNPE